MDEAEAVTVRSSRPAGITVIAWLWIVIGSLMIFSAVMGGIAYSMMPGAEGPGLPAEVALRMAPMNLLLQNFLLVISVQFAIAVLAVWSGVGLLRQHGWARSLVEGLSWLGLLWTVGVGGYWVYMWTSVTSQTSGSDMFHVMGAAMGAFGTLTLAVPLGIMIWYLRSDEARKAVLAQ